MIQALEYGTQGWFPNGTHPVGAVYIDVDPALADFNIHPAKREARFKDAGAIHHSITATLRDFVRRGDLARQAREGGMEHRALPCQASLPYGTPVGNAANAAALALNALLDKPPEFAPLPGRRPEDQALFGETGSFGAMAGPFALSQAAEPRPVYGDSQATDRYAAAKPRLAGRIFKLFLLAELGDRLFIIDQHAAHERILYDRFLSKPITTQELLAPIPFSTASEDDDNFLASHIEDLRRLGIVITGDGGGGWLVEALPAGWQAGDGETVDEILKLRTARENIAEHWAATLSCHSAVKDGDYLDDNAALALAEAALALPVPRCPHGRPIWVEITREALFHLVQRT
jgi:DNA mismatch repair protein MutL